MKPLSKAPRKLLATAVMAAAMIMVSVCPGNALDKSPQSGQKQDANKEKAYKIDEVKVTAQKREESFQEVPISISTFNGMQIEEAGMSNMEDLFKYIPNVHLKHAEPENTIIIRGITSFHSSIYAPTGFYVDDVNFPLQYMHNIELFDIERVEVLKGPQGTLYGRNAESGVINVITRQPGNEFHGKILAEYGNYNSTRVAASVSGPLVEDKLFLGASIQKSNSDGYYTNVSDDNDEISSLDHLSARATLRWKPSSRWDISLIADMVDHQDGYGIYRFLNGSYQTDRHEVSCDYPDNKMDQSGDGETLRIKYSGNGFDFLSVTSNRSYERLLLYDRDGTSYPSQYANFTWDDTQRSQEFRIYSNNENSPFKWLFGVYGFMEEVGTVNDVESLYYGTLWDNRTDMDISGFAAFTHLTYTFWNRLHLTAGLRFDHHDLEGELTGAPSYLTAAGQKLSAELNYDELLPKFALSFDCTDNIMCYATVAKGYLIGGFNYVSAYSQQAFTYDSEYTWNYEVGVKTSWLDDKLWVNAALFYIDMKDKQVFETDQTVPIAGAQNIKNAAEAHSVGGEIELHARPLRGLDLFAGFSIIESKIDDWLAVESDGSSYDYEGKYLTYYPKETINVGVQYHHASGLFGRVDLFYYGQSYCDPENLIEQDAYQEVNLRLGYMGENFDIIFWGKNLFDEEYFNYMTYYGSNVLVVDGPPRTFGATLVYHF